MRNSSCALSKKQESLFSIKNFYDLSDDNIVILFLLIMEQRQKKKYFEINYCMT